MMHLLFRTLEIKMNVPSLSSHVSLYYWWFIHDSFINLLRLRDKLLDIVIANVNMAPWSRPTTHVWFGEAETWRPVLGSLSDLTCLLGLGPVGISVSDRSHVSHKPWGKLYFLSLMIVFKFWLVKVSIYEHSGFFLVIKWELCLVLCCVYLLNDFPRTKLHWVRFSAPIIVK